MDVCSNRSPVSRSPALFLPDTWLQQLRTLRPRGSTSVPAIENSRALRILVQLLVSVGIASISVAAAGVTRTSILNLLAIPLSAVGGYWSWRSRQRSNIAIKFIIAFGMLTALGIFLARLVGEGSDTRIQLAELLIHLQVLHSFDMPRRKDLGYSIVIALILLGVAATVSQTLTLAPVLIVFLAIALPVLILDYQSRLGLAGRGQRQQLASFNLKRQAWLLILVMGLGLVIFAALPRLPGYQIRNFPVSNTIDFEGNFTGDQIVNPGYASGGGNTLDDGTPGDSTTIQGGSPVEGSGAMSGSTYYGFSRQMNQNLRGAIEPQPVMRVRAQAAGFWRMLAFDRYTGQGWEISRSNPEAIEILGRSGLSYQTFLPDSAFQGGRTNTAGRRREIVQTYTLVNELPNLIPALYQASKLYFPTREVAIDAEGSLRSPVPLSAGVTFTVISEVPYRDRTQLREATTTYDEPVRTHYLQLPETIQGTVRQHTEELLARSPQPLTDPYEKALYLAQALKQTYTLKTDLPFFAEDEDLVEAFLFRYEGGYADHFSTVLTVMLRSIDIPARLVAGFAPGEFNPFTGYYVVNNTDAYVMTEVYFPEYGWFAFDPIPGHDVVPVSIRDSQTFSVLKQFWNWVAGWLPSPVSSWIGRAVLGLFDFLSRLLNFFSQSVIGIIAGLLSATGLAFLGWLIWRSWRKWRRYLQLKQLPPVEQVYQQLLMWLSEQGYPKRPTQTPLEYAIALQQTAQFPHGERVLGMIQAYTRWRYGARAENADQLRQQMQTIKRHSKR